VNPATQSWAEAKAARDALKDRKLRTIKGVATGLLVLAAAAYVAATFYTERYPLLAYFAATCEAAMVGALADWFAVVALFRHPLNVPLPHTAIIPRGKERIAEGLGAFVQEKFLSNEAIVARIRELNPANQLASWLLRPENAGALASYTAGLLAYALGALDDRRVREFLQRTVTAKLYALDAASLLGRILEVLTENKRHHALLEQALAGLHELLSRDETRDYVAGEISKQWPLMRWLTEILHIDRMAARKMLELVIAKIAEVRENPEHELRARFDAYAEGFISQLKSDPATREKVDQLRDEVLQNPALAQYVGGLWEELKTWLEADLERASADDSVVHRRLMELAATLGARLDAEPQIKDWVNEQIIANAPRLVEEHREGVGRFIERQINAWQEATLVRELERNIGPDLQYIRINGTLVGGAAGLLIYSLTRLAMGGH
jgi:uncharacterized membrane-anchored protein YjiN (DUF445 family)